MMKPHVIVGGENWFKFFSNFNYGGKTYCFNFYARDKDEAEKMLRSIRTTAIECHQIQGEISASVPASGLFVKVLCGLRNLFS